MTFRSRVFKNQAEKDAWVKRMNEAGRANYEYFAQKRPQAYLKMRKDAQLSTSSPNAGTVGSAPTFDVGKKRRRRRSMKVTKHAGQVNDELHDPRLWSNLRGAFTSAEAMRHDWSRGVKTAMSDARAQRMPDIDDRSRDYKKKWLQKNKGARPMNGYLKEGASFDAGVKHALLKAAQMTAGEHERETSAPGVTGGGAELHRPRGDRLPGNQRSGVPMWIRYSKNLQSRSTWNQGDTQPLRGVDEQRV